MARRLFYVLPDGNVMPGGPEDSPFVKGKALDCGTAEHNDCGCLLEGAEPGTRAVAAGSRSELARHLGEVLHPEGDRVRLTEEACDELARAVFERGIGEADGGIRRLAAVASRNAGGRARKADREAARLFYEARLRDLGKAEAAAYDTADKFGVCAATVKKWKAKGWR